MGKKKAEPEPAEEEEPQEEQVPQSGEGSFAYVNDSVYDGEWQIFDGKKLKHGKGKIVHGSSSAEGGAESYTGEWSEDLMHGKGTYRFTSGAIYEGDW